jgi:zinc transporter ZupT
LYQVKLFLKDMSLTAHLFLWALTTGIAVFALFSSTWAPLHKRLLPWTGGVLVGLSVFWILPDLAVNEGWIVSLAGISAGVLLLLLFDRYVYPVCPFCAFGGHEGHAGHLHDDSANHTHYFEVGWPLLIAGCVHNFFDGWMLELAHADGAGTLSSALSWGFAAHKILESFAIGLLASAFASRPSRGLGIIVLVQGAFAAGSIAVFYAGGLNEGIVDLCIGSAAATLMFFGLSALRAEWRLRGAFPAFRVGMFGIGGCGLLAFALRLIGY